MQDPVAFDRREFLGIGAITFGTLASMDWPGLALAQQPGAVAAASAGKTLSERLAEFVASSDLKRVPPEVIDRARVAFIDTVGVMLAGSREDVARLACD
jgi:hypothetical protein